MCELLKWGRGTWTITTTGFFGGQVQLSLSDVRKVTGLAAASVNASFFPSYPPSHYSPPRSRIAGTYAHNGGEGCMCCFCVRLGGVSYRRDGIPCNAGVDFRLVVK